MTNMKKDHHERPVSSGLVILDYGSQYTLLIARRLREIGVYCEVLDGAASEAPTGFDIEGIVLSGGPDSVQEENARQLPSWVLKSEKPVLGICYGLQLLASALGGKVRGGEKREYGRSTLALSSDLPQPAASMFYNTPTHQTVWMSHGDDVEHLPDSFDVVGTSDGGVIAAVVHKTLPLVGLQFHPEVQHSECGMQLLKQFVVQVCKAKLNWHQETLVQTSLDYVRRTVGESGHVLMAVSGGVDSTVATALMIRALGASRVHCVFVDHGLLRKNEAQWVKEQMQVIGMEHLTVLDRSHEFLSNLAGVSDPEKKRKIIGETFIKEFELYSNSHKDCTHLGQGTLYPDVIESAGHGSGSKVIKSHHNVGGLPEKLKLKLCEPFRFLFKDEVRRLGAELGVPKILIDRHPFPGPGLAVRILGDVDAKKVSILQEADAIFIQALQDRGFYMKVWQAFAVLLPVRSVGVMGDNRTYEQCICLRSVTSSDGMTAGVGELPLSFLTAVADQIIRQVKGVNRVVYDITTKPPATIEWE